MTTLVSESKTRCLENRRLLADSHFRIACGRRLLNPWWALAGAAHAERHPSTNGTGLPWPPYELTCLIHDRIKGASLLVLSNAKCWARPATGKVCVVCEHRIVGGAECEVGEPDSGVFAHLVCHSIWCKESRDFREQDSAGGSADLLDSSGAA